MKGDDVTEKALDLDAVIEKVQGWRDEMESNAWDTESSGAHVMWKSQAAAYDRVLALLREMKR